MALFLPLAFLTRRTWLYRQISTSGSALIALVATVWLVERVFEVNLLPM